jgi:broad specificity phosphatase PhoE
MAVILLVRHGQASWDAEDYDQLSEAGLEQSGTTGQWLASHGVQPTAVVTGTMRRHVQTAEAAAGAGWWSAATTQDVGWNEFDHVQMLAVHGAPDGNGDDQMTRGEFNAWFESAARRWASGDHDTDYDEPFHAFTARVEGALRRTTSALGPGDVAVVFTSGGPITWVVATLLGGGVDAWTRLNPVTVNASVTKLVVGARGTTLVSFNEHGHLEPDRVTYR